MKKLKILIVSALLAIGIFGISENSRATAPDALGGSAFPLTFVTQPVTNLLDAFNEMLQIISAQTVGISPTYSNAMTEPTGGADTSQAIFSTTLQKNPLAMSTSLTANVAQNSAAPFTILASATGRTIYPGNVVIEALGGNLAGATNVKILCNPSGTTIGTYTIAALVSGIPVGLFSSTAVVTVGSAEMGCSASDAVQASFTGSAATTATSLVISLPDYTVQ